MQQLVLQMQHGQLLPHQLEELHRIQLVFATRLALRVQRGAQEIGVVDAGNFHRVLKGQEQASGGAFFRRQVEKILAVELHAACADLIAVSTGQYIAQRGLTRAIGTHDGVYLAGLDVQRQALEDVFAGDAGVEVVDCEHGIFHQILLAPLLPGEGLG